MSTKNLSEKQLTWLRQKGGRDISDVRVDSNGEMFVYMGDGEGSVKPVYIPDDEA